MLVFVFNHIYSILFYILFCDLSASTTRRAQICYTIFNRECDLKKKK